MRARHLRLRRRELGGSRLGRRGHGNLRLRSKTQLQVVTVRRRIQRAERARRFTAGTEEAQHLKPWTEEAGSSSVEWKKLGDSRLRGRYVGSCTYIYSSANQTEYYSGHHSVTSISQCASLS